MRGTLRASIWLLATSATASSWAQFEAAPPTAPGSATSGPSLRRDGGSPSAEATNPRLRSTAEQRAWLKGRLDAGIQNRGEVAKYSRQLDRFTPQQIDVLTNMVLAQQLPNDLQQATDLARLELQRAILLRQLLERELLWRRRGGVGYMPVVTWLPQGTSLGGRAVISPDGRYARVSSSPFFSSIGPVYTYNLGTGRTRLQRPYPYRPYGYGNGYYPQGYQGYTNSPGFGQLPPQHLPPRQSSADAKVNTWYDGVRTRVGPR